MTPDLECVLWAVLEYFEEREDVQDGDYGMPEANLEMQMGTQLREAMNGAGMRFEGKLITKESNAPSA